MTITEHLGAMLASYRARHDLLTVRDCDLADQHKAWLDRHQQRLAAAEILDAFGFEVVSMPTAMRARIAFDDGARIIINSQSGSMLPTLADWQIMAFAADGHWSFDATSSSGKPTAARLRAQIEKARERVDPTLLQPCAVQQ